MVFGRKRQTWTTGDPDSKKLKMSTVQYMEKLNGKLEMVHNIARENITHAQERMKRLYDKTAKQRELLPGEKALILMPTSNNKLMATWKGPYTVLRRLQNNNYELDLGKRKTVLHINSLRKYNEDETPNTVNVVISETDIETESDITPLAEESGAELMMLSLASK